MIRKNLVIVSIVIAAAVIVNAAAPQFRLFATAEDMEKGSSLGVSIGAFGVLTLAPETTQLHSAALPNLWCLANDAQGNVLVGGGNPARVLALKLASATGSAKATTIFTGDEHSVFAVLPRGKDLYVATSPDGQIYRLDAERKVQKYFKPEAKYIWALAAGANGALYAATGSPARLYRIDREDKGSIIFECDEQHVRSLHFSNKGWLYLGSSGNGYIYRLRPDGSEVSVLYDAPLDEILQVLPADDGAVYAAAAGQARGVPPGVGGQPGEVATIDDDEPLEESQAAPARPGDEALAPLLASGQQKSKSALYRISPNGQVKDLWNARADHIHSAILEKAGTLLVGTGDRGRLYRVTPDGSRALLVEMEAPQLTALSLDGRGDVLMTSSNPGVVTLLRNNLRATGEYRSEVIDAKVASRWGAVSWEQEGAGAVRFSTRSGNTGKPDKTWSAWAAVESKANGGISSPLARFLQWRVELEKKEESSPQLKRVQISYLQNNVAPEITQITIHPPGDYFPDAAKKVEDGDKNETNGRAGNNQDPGRKTFQKGAQSISWQARDENNDRLQFSLFYRMVGETAWREISKNVQAAAYSWDSQTMPDGEYQVRIIASDAKSNPPAMEAVGEKISLPFVVDNTPPVVERVVAKKEGGQMTFSFAAADALNRLKEAWYAVDAGEWQLVYPRDGVVDQRREQFAITLNALTGGHTLTVKVSDAAGNVGFGRASFGE
jgi:hypothetical protein